MYDFTQFIFGSFIFYVSYFILGIFIFEKFYSKLNILSLFECTLIGIFAISFIALFINFFSALTPAVNLCILVGKLSLIFFIKKKNFHFLLKYSLIFALALIVFTYYGRNPEDAGLYHLSYISILNNEKISFGITNFHTRFGHTSLVQYLSAVSYIPILSKHIIISQNNFIYCLILLIFLKRFKINLNRNEIYAASYNFLSLSYISLKLAKFSDWGNDLAPTIMTLYLISFLIDYLSRKQKISQFSYYYFYLITLLIFIAFSKPSYIILFSSIFLLLLKVKTIKYFFNFKLISFFTVLVSIIFLKNLIISSCLFYPIPFTCVDTMWSAGELNNVEKIYLNAKSWAMSISDSKNLYAAEIFIKNFNWLESWSQKHLLKIIEKIFSFIFFVSIIFILFSRVLRIKKNLELKFSFHKYLLFYSLLCVFIWFTTAPLYRYGEGFIIATVILLIIPFFARSINIRSHEYKKLYKITLVIIISTIATKNFLRILNEPEKNIVPKTFELKKLNNMTFNKQKIFFYNGNSCFYPKYSPCLKNMPDGLKNILLIKNYKIYLHK
mgnify:FL=1